MPWPCLRGVCAAAARSQKWFKMVMDSRGAQEQTKFRAAGVYYLMSVSSEPPERIAEILLEILALSNATRTGPFESGCGSDPMELYDEHCGKEQSPRSSEENSNTQTP